MGVRVFQERQGFTQWWLWLVVIVPLGILLYQPITLLIKQPDFSLGDLDKSFWIALGVLIVVHLFLAQCHLHTEINENGIHYQFKPFHFHPKRVNWGELENVYVRKYRPVTEYGGWGYRVGFGGIAYNVKGNQGIQLKFKSGKKLLIGTQRPKEVKEIVNKYFKHERI